jgi:CBS domain-containing protein
VRDSTGGRIRTHGAPHRTRSPHPRADIRRSQSDACGETRTRKGFAVDAAASTAAALCLHYGKLNRGPLAFIGRECEQQTKENAMKLGEQFKKDVASVAPDATIRRTAHLMRERGVGAVVVVDAKNKPVGIVTDRDVAMALAVDERDPDALVREIMPGELITIGENEGIFNATQYIFGYQIRRLPIVDGDGRLVGIVTMDDLLGLLARELGNLAEGAIQPVLVAAEG